MIFTVEQYVDYDEPLDLHTATLPPSQLPAQSLLCARSMSWWYHAAT
jgi:hypothetical protein